jgi:CHAD domain-containing protein
MENDSLKNWLNERVNRIRKNAESIQPGYPPEPIHHMRTETKRVRAMLRLLSSEKSEEGKLPKSYRKLYRIAGSIRDPQVHLTELFGPRLPKMPMFSLWLARQMAFGVADWEKKFSGETMDELKSFCDGLASESADLDVLINYFKKRKKEIQQLLQNDPEDEDLHQIRKYCKDLLYLLAFCEDNWPEGWQLLGRLEPSLKRLSDRAGAFNDKRNLLDVSTHFLKDYENELEDEDLAGSKRAIEHWTVQKEQARKRLLASVRALLRRKIPAVSRKD